MTNPITSSQVNPNVSSTSSSHRHFIDTCQQRVIKAAAGILETTDQICKHEIHFQIVSAVKLFNNGNRVESLQKIENILIDWELFQSSFLERSNKNQLNDALSGIIKKLREQLNDRSAVDENLIQPLNNILELRKNLGLNDNDEIENTEIVILTCISLICVGTGKIEDALLISKKILEIAKKKNIQVEHYYNYIGSIYTNLKRDREALHYYTEALMIVDQDVKKGKKHDKINLLNIYSNIINCLKTLKKVDEARKYVDKAIDVYQEIPLKEGEVLENFFELSKEILHKKSPKATSELWQSTYTKIYCIAISKYLAHSEYEKALISCREIRSYCRNGSQEANAIEILRQKAETGLRQKILALAAVGQQHLEKGEFSKALNFFKTLPKKASLFSEELSREFHCLSLLTLQKSENAIQKALEICHNYCNEKKWEKAIHLLTELLIVWNTQSIKNESAKPKFLKLLKKMQTALETKEQELSLKTKTVIEQFSEFFNSEIYKDDPKTNADYWLALTSIFQAIDNEEKATFCITKGTEAALLCESPLQLALLNESHINLLLWFKKEKSAIQLIELLLERTNDLDLNELNIEERDQILEIQKKCKSKLVSLTSPTSLISQPVQQENTTHTKARELLINIVTNLLATLENWKIFQHSICNEIPISNEAIVSYNRSTFNILKHFRSIYEMLPPSHEDEYLLQQFINIINITEQLKLNRSEFADIDGYIRALSLSIVLKNNKTKFNQ